VTTESPFKPCPTCGVTITGWDRILHEATDDSGLYRESVPIGFHLEPCGHRIFAEGFAPPVVPEVRELEAIPAGLSPDQEIRARALDAATRSLLPFEHDMDERDDADAMADLVLPLARRYAAWIADGDPAVGRPITLSPRGAVVAALRALDPDDHGRLITIEDAMTAAERALTDAEVTA
jgi:hypothetical protein